MKTEQEFQQQEQQRKSKLWALLIVAGGLFWIGYTLYSDYKMSRLEMENPPLTLSENKTHYRVGDYFELGELRGVVFEVDSTGLHGKILSLEGSKRPLRWCEDEILASKSDFLISTENGAENTTRKGRGMAFYPAFKWCVKLGEGWYLPAKDELVSLALHHEEINPTLKRYGKELEAELWSSTCAGKEETLGAASAWRVSVETGELSKDRKLRKFHVRAVARF